MNNVATLVIGDHLSTIFNDVGTKKVRILLNMADMDVSEIKIPPLNFLDRRRLCKQRLLNTSPHALTGATILKQSLIENTCPFDPVVKDWINKLLAAGKTIISMQPLLVPPKGNHDHTIVISYHKDNGYRHTAYIKGVPIFTRVTPIGLCLDHVLATLTYLRNQFQFETCTSECLLDVHDFELLKPLAGENIELCHTPLDVDKLYISLNSPYYLKMPENINASKISARHNLFQRFGAIASMLLLCFGGWQYYDHENLQTSIYDKNNSLEKVNQQVMHLKANLPLDKLLPETYAQPQTNPVALLHQISHTINGDLQVSGLKWENTSQDERLILEIHVLNQEEDADQKVDVIQDFKTQLQDLLPDFQIQTQSLPHGSAEQETFTGSATHKDLTLSGDQTKARLLLIRKKNT